MTHPPFSHSRRLIMWIFWPNKSASRRLRGARPRSLLTVEALEDRTVPSLTWSSGVALPSARSGDAAFLASDESILALGGTTTVNQLALTGTAWTTASALDQVRVSPGISSLGGGELLVYGGAVSGTAVSSALVYDPANSSNTHTAASMSTARNLMAFAADGLGRAYAIGGIDASGTRLATVERYDPSSGAWAAVASLPLARSGAAAVYDGNGDILVFGGATTSSRTNAVLKYAISTNTWTTLASMPTSTTEAAAVFGPDGMVYVLGGKGSEGALTTVQVYNPTTNKWSTGTALPKGVSDEAAVIDAQNRIDIIGGKSSSGSAVTSVYVTQSLANFAPQITTASTALSSATAGAAYTATIAAIGSPAPTFSVVSGPTGLNIDQNTGIITWTPTISQIGTTSVTIQAANVTGTSQQTFSLTVTPDISPPTVPVLTVNTVTTTSSIPLSWTTSTDNVGVAGYRLYQYTPAVYRGHSGRGGGITLVSPAKYTLIADNITDTSYTVTGLAPNTTEQFAVAAFDAAGNQSAYSTVVSGTTLLAPSITYYVSSSVNPALSVVANHQLYFTLSASGNPAPTMSLLSAPDGVVFDPGQITNSQLTFVVPNITWTPTADQVGVQDIVMQATNSVGTYTLDIVVTVTADVPVPSLTVNGGYAYGVGNMTTMSGNPNSYQLTLNPGFDTGTHPQYALAGNAFSFQFGGTSNTEPTTYAIVSGPSSMTIDPDTGAGSWTPSVTDASAATSVEVSATNSAGTTYLTFTFPTYFTTAPTNVAVNFDTSTSGSSPSTWTPVVTWDAPTDSTNVAGYRVLVTNLNTGVTTTYDTQSTATSFSLPAGITGQNSVNVVAYDANGNPSQTSTSNAQLYLVALGTVSWSIGSANVIAGQALSVQFSGSYVTYGIASGPSGVTIDPNSGVLSWTPGLSDVGNVTIVVSVTNNNGWGTVYATLNFPVSFTDAPTNLSVTSGTDPVSGEPTWTASWAPPTLNTSSIAGYQIVVTDASAPAGTPPTVYTVSPDTLSLVISNQATFQGTIQVTAFDAFGNLGVPSAVYTV
jgi:hypothetical protein